MASSIFSPEGTQAGQRGESAEASKSRKRGKPNNAPIAKSASDCKTDKNGVVETNTPGEFEHALES